MKAITRHQYGPPDVLELAEVDRPEVGDDEVLVKIHAASANASDIELLTAGAGEARGKVVITM